MNFAQHRNLLTKLRRSTAFFSVSISMAFAGVASKASAQQTWTPSAVQESTLAPEASASNGNLHEVAEKLPEISRSLALMEKMPLTGKPVFNVLVKPENNITTTLVPHSPGQPFNAEYHNRKIRIPRGVKTSVTFHESFHAAQDICGGDGATLTAKDAAIDMLLVEATAVVYEIAAKHEAESLHLSFYEPAPIGAGGHPPTIIVTAASSLAIQIAFQSAYDQARQEYTGTAVDYRMAKALEAGGKAVVRFLLEGRDPGWREVYKNLVQKNLNNSMGIFITDNEKPANYQEHRREAFIKLNCNLPDINFIPDEYLGPDADKYIDACFKRMDFRIEPAQTAPAAVPQQAAKQTRTTR